MKAGDPTGSAALTVSDVSKSFAGRPVLSDVSLSVSSGEVHALVGENGCGKSTLIKVLSGYHEPDGGEVRVAGLPLSLGSAKSSYQLGCRFVHQDLGLIDESSVIDNILMNTGFPTRLGTIRTGAARRTVAEDLQRAGLSIKPDVEVGSLSPAEKTGVAVAKALRPDPDSEAKLLVLDEPTATLPEGEVTRLLEMIRTVTANGIGVIYVTHRLGEVFDVADNVTVLRNGYKVATEKVSALTRPELINLMIGHELEEISQEREAIHLTHGEPTLKVGGIAGGPIKDISFTVRAGEVVGIAGITGSGAESLLSTIFGGAPRAAGSVEVNGAQVRAERPDRAMAAGMAYMPPDRKTAGGMLELSARENLTIGSLGPFSSPFWLRQASEKREVKGWFKDLNVQPPTGAENQLGTFSGGNQQKVLFAKWLRLKPSVFLLDEPTQGVDIGAKALLHRQLLAAGEEGMAIVVSSTDMDELVALCERVIVIRDGLIVADLRREEVSLSSISRNALGTQAGGSV
ncbi:MAG: sugar ABC transporter ATP-binding protein [Actinobacteria bacterium]|nr:sugar ABC transporter ATP-binding protein [Actinomycetota bacterium]